MEKTTSVTATNIAVSCDCLSVHKNLHLNVASNSQKGGTRKMSKTREQIIPIHSETAIFHDKVTIQEKCSHSKCPNTIKKIDKVRYNVDDPVGSFCGRQGYLENLQRDLKSVTAESVKGSATALSYLKIISGDKGAGKTQLVRKYIMNVGNYYSNIIWINAESENSIEKCFHELSVTRLGLDETKWSAQNTSRNIQEIYEILCTRKTLIVFDGAECYRRRRIEDDGKAIINFLPQTIPPHLKIPAILITTTRAGDWGPLSKPISLTPFSPDESVHFITRELDLENNQEDIQSVQNLVENLQDHEKYPAELNKIVQFIIQRNQKCLYTSKGSFTVQDYIRRQQLLKQQSIQFVVVNL